MDIKLEHACTIDRKIGSGARAVREIFDFFSVTLLMGHPVYMGKISQNGTYPPFI